MSNSKRLLSLDILRGLTVAGMILVNNGFGESFMPLQHSKWNGMTPCDLVFPFFLFIMGVSMYLSMSKTHFKPTGTIFGKIIRRTFLLFLIGLVINWLELATKDGNWGCFDHLRVWGVLQRIALCYGIVSILVVTLSHRWILPVVAFLLTGYAVVLVVGDGYVEDATNILARVDRAVVGTDHLYTKSPIDPEGLLGTVSAVAHVLLGFYVGMRIKKNESFGQKSFAVLITASLLIIGGWLLSFGLPFNKRIWSPSYVLITCGMASALLGVLIYLVDMRKKQKWTTFFHVFGINPLALYVLSELLAILFKRTGTNDVVYNAFHSTITHPQTASLLYAISFVLINFLFGYLLYRKKIYIKL